MLRGTEKASPYLQSIQAQKRLNWDNHSQSAYEVKMIAAYLKGFSVKVRRMGCFFGTSVFVLEIFTFLYYANDESDDIINSPI